MSEGVGRELAASFLESVAGYGESPAVTPPSEDRPVKLATVDPGWTTGNPRVLFDGETIMGVRGYPWAGLKPRPGERVVLLPQGHSYVIIGTVGGDLPIASTSARGIVELATPAEAIAGTDATRAVTPAALAAAQNMTRGTAAQRVGRVPRYWEFWQDTDGSKYLWVGDRTGGWRRFSGTSASGSRAWDSTATNLAGRTDTHTLPTYVQDDETILISSLSIGTGFGFLAVSAITRGSATSAVAVRFMQIMALSTQAYRIGWQLAQTETY